MFLDFEKAYDRMDRGWLMQRMCFPAQAQRWVQMMLAGTRAGVVYHGYMSPCLPVYCLTIDVMYVAAQGSSPVVAQRTPA
jgi:hypothetical protein